MKRLLYAWEYGSGLGHLVRCREILSALAVRGLHVIVATTRLNRARAFFENTSLEIIEATPILQELPKKQSRCYAELMLYNGYEAANELGRSLQTWVDIYERHKIDGVIADFSPTAILAARTRPEIPVFRIGTSFCCPSSAAKDVVFHSDWPMAAEEFQACIEKLLNSINFAFEKSGNSVHFSTWDAIHKCDETFLMTFAETDHFGASHKSPDYYGPILSSEGAEPIWKSVKRPRVFVYLKNFQHTIWLMDYLSQTHVNSLVYTDDKTASFCRLNGCRLAFSTDTLDMREVATKCDFAITHGGHGVVVDMLLAGKPVLCLPLVLEQQLLANRIAAQGLGVVAQINSRRSIIEAVRKMHRDASLASNASVFSKEHENYSSLETVNRIADKIFASLT